MKKKRGIFAGRQQTPPAIPPTQISDAKLLADLDVNWEVLAEAIQTVMALTPTTHYVSLAQSILFRGAGLEVVWPAFAMVTAIGALFLTLAHHRLRHTIGTMQN